MPKKEIEFSFFRYQLLPKSSKIDLFYPLERRNLDVEDLKQRKNEIFRDILQRDSLNIIDSHSGILKYKKYTSNDDLFIFKLGKKKSITIANEDLVDVEQEDYPSVWVIINNDPNVQVIAISSEVEAFSTPFVVANILEENFTRICSDFSLEVKINPILNATDFWNLVSKYQNRITQIKFTLIRPNLANISGTFKDEIRALTDSTNSVETKVELNAPKDGTLENINQDNARIKALTDYSTKGGGQTIKLKVKGLKRIISTEKTISKTEIKSVELSGSPEKVLEMFKEITKNE